MLGESDLERYRAKMASATTPAGKIKYGKKVYNFFIIG